MARNSHWRRFTADEWADGVPGAAAVHVYGDGDVLAHCSGLRDHWQAAHGDLGAFQGDRIGDLPALTQKVALRRRITRTVDGRTVRDTIAMNATVPDGWTTAATDAIPHLWQGETADDVR